MTSLFILALLTSSAQPRVAVVVGRRTSITQSDAEAMAQTVSNHLTAAGVPLFLDADASRAKLNRLGLTDASGCKGRRACLTELGRQLEATHMISLSVSRVGPDRSLAIDLLQVTDGSVLEQDALILGPRAPVAADQLAGFAARARARLGPTAAEPAPTSSSPPIAPTSLAQTSSGTLPVSVSVQSAPPVAPRSRLTPVVLGVAAVAALAVAGGLLVSGVNARSDAIRTTVLDGTPHSPYSASEALRRSGDANLRFGLSGAAAAAGLGLGISAVVTW